LHIENNLPNTESQKIIYFFAERDSKRSKITKEELCNLGWQFRYFQDPNATPFFPIHQLNGKYHNDGVSDDFWFWSFSEDETEVICNNYPGKKLKRTKDWVFPTLN
jgi:hypothetical protein